MTDQPYFVVDAFTDTPFAGNPAAVCPLDAWLPDATMQAIAAELALSETAFFARDGEALRLRWFTPAVEVDLCGHATLASGHVLLNRLEPGRGEVTFMSRSGPLGVRKDGDRLVLDFPSRPPAPEPDAQTRDDVAAALGRRPRELWRARGLVAVYDSADDVRRLQPDFGRLRALDVFSVCATAAGPGARDPGPGRPDFVSRFFAPREGVDEDPVTGSAHCTLAPLWAERLGRSSLLGHQISRRGGFVDCRLDGDRVQLGGHAVLVASGTLHLP